MEEKSIPNNKKIFGLDVLRVSAIFMVVFSHLFLFSPSKSIIKTQFAPLLGFLGVEIVLVLSGFLIGNKVYEMIVLQDKISISGAFHYLKQRSWRILPNYFLVLLLAIIISFWFQYPVDNLWEYFFFLQNIIQPMPLFFSENWSVSIGFFGNLILILGMPFIFNRLPFRNKATVFLAVIFAFILFSFACKLCYHLNAKSTTLLQWNSNLKSVVIYRLDSFFLGSLCSWIYFNVPNLWNNYKRLMLIFGLLLLGFMFVGVGYLRWLIDSKPFFWNVLYLPITSIAIMLFLPIFSQYHLENSFVKRIITVVSKISYAVYLIHYSILLQLMCNFFDTKSFTSIQFFLFSITYLTITLFLSFLLYDFYEKPIQDNVPKN